MKVGKSRFAAAVVGVALWLGYPFIFLFGNAAQFRYACRLKPAQPGHDPCFTDYIPVLEMAAFGGTLCLAYPFARFAFSLFAPHEETRSRPWVLPGRSAPGGWFPSFQLAVGLGLAWALFHHSMYSAALVLWPYHAYWATWSAWFVLGLCASWPERQHPAN